MCKQRLFADAAMRRLDASIHGFRSSLPSLAAVEAYDQLIRAVRTRTRVVARDALWQMQPDVARTLAAMSLHHRGWLRSVASWAPPNESVWRVLASLAQHLFARFAMPRFLASVWRDGHGDVTVLPQHTWYLRLGAGDSPRRIGLPLRLTRAMAHRFLQAPDDATVIRALRCAQVITLGGSDALLQAVMATRLGRYLEHEEHWEDVIRFLVRYPELPLYQVGPIIDFVYHQKLAVREGIASDGTYQSLPPPCRELSMKGRTPSSMLQLVVAWHAALGQPDGAICTWPRSSIGELRYVESVRQMATRRVDEPAEELCVWTISELCSSHALLAEGRAMHHCVARYTQACLWGHTSIWSMQLETRRGRRRVATIEVRKRDRRIVQARRAANRWPSAKEYEVIAQWAARESVVLGNEAMPTGWRIAA